MVAGGRLLAQVLGPGRPLCSPNTGHAYVLQRLLGEGAHGQVWLARRGADGCELAAKVVLPAAHDEAELIAAEIAKAKAASDFVQDLVPRFEEAFSVECQPTGAQQPLSLLVIVMEYVDGCSLDAIVRRHPVPEGHASVILRSLCLALQRLHAHGWIHRDVKGANVMVASSGRVYLCDFGVSRCLERAGDRAQTVAGTPYWMAPEVVGGARARGETGYDTKADVWSLGITAIELVEGGPPLSQDVLCKANALHVFHIVAKRQAPRLAPCHSIALRHFVARCLVKNPSRRASVTELLEDPQGFVLEMPNGRLMLQDMVEYVQADVAPAHAEASAQQSLPADLAAEPGLATLTVAELRSSLARAPEVVAEGGEEEDGDAPPPEFSLAPLSRQPLRAVDVHAPGERLPSAAAPPAGLLRRPQPSSPPTSPSSWATLRPAAGQPGHPGSEPPALLRRPCPSSPPPSPPATLGWAQDDAAAPHARPSGAGFPSPAGPGAAPPAGLMSL